jgi:hypothetical protein
LGYLMGIFHGWDQWKSAMMTLPEDVFFDLLRSVFGNIKTPFNKQNLLSDLAAFLSRDDIRRNIAAYLDEADAQALTAVALLGNPTAAELERFFAGDDIEISALLLNLEERFILYRYREGDLLRLGLNPVLEPVLSAITEDMSKLFPSLPLEAAEDRGEAPLDDRFFAALVSFVLEAGRLFKPEGRRMENQLRKKVRDSGRRIFPGLDLELAIRALLCLGLCRFASPGGAALPAALSAASPAVKPPDSSGLPAAPGLEGEVLKPEDRALRDFGELEPRQRLIYWAAGLYLGAEIAPDTLPPQLLRGRVRGLARLIDRFLDFLSPGRVYPPRTLRHILFFLEHGADELSAEPSGPGLQTAAGPALLSSADPAPAIDAGLLCAALARAGLLRGTPQAYGLPPEPAGGPAESGVSGERDATAPDVSGQDAPGTPVLTLDAPLFCLVHPGIDFTDALTLALFTSVRETGRIFRFEISRESCLRGFERGLGAADMGELLTRLSGNRLEASLLWTLRDWEKRSTEVALFEGAVLALSPERHYLVEAEPLASLIRRELAPGLYLLGSGDQAAEALRKAGVDIFTRCGEEWEPGGGPAFGGRGTRNPFPPLKKEPPGYQDNKGSAMIDTAVKMGPPRGDLAGAEALKARFHKVLKDRTLSMPERNELASRVERKLVLAESQLSSASVRGEKLEARDLDYVGKASIAKYAISSRSLVEVLWSAGDSGGEQRILGVPLALEKSGGESILVIGDSRVRREAETPRADGNTDSAGSTVRIPGNTVRIPGNTIRIPLGKISLLRRIKKSMFEA